MKPGDVIADRFRIEQRAGSGGMGTVYHATQLHDGGDVAMARAIGLRYAVGSSLHNLGEARYRLGDLGAARAALTESLELAEAWGYDRLAALDRAHLAYLDGLEGAADA